jgi:hypothetical protein
MNESKTAPVFIVKSVGRKLYAFRRLLERWFPERQKLISRLKRGLKAQQCSWRNESYSQTAPASQNSRSNPPHIPLSLIEIKNINEKKKRSEAYCFNVSKKRGSLLLIRPRVPFKNSRKPRAGGLYIQEIFCLDKPARRQTRHVYAEE